MFYKFIENFLTHSECDELIDYCLKHELIQAGTYVPSTKEIKEDLNFNKRRYVFLNYVNLTNLDDRIINTINENLKSNGILYDKTDRYLFNEYKETDFLEYHIDGHEIENGATITILIQLNDDYEGGEFYYKIDDEFIVPKIKGSMFIFDSNILHKVNPVKNGIRYSINLWPKFKITKKNII